MLELTIILIAVVFIFILAMWYANYRSKQRSKLFELDVESFETIPEKPEHEFGALFQKQMDEPEHSSPQQTLDAEPELSLSQTAREHSLQTEANPRVVSETDVENSSQQTPVISADDQDLTTEQVASADFTVNSEHDDEIVIVLNVLAKPQQQFKGSDIKTVLESLQLQFGDMQIYHKLSSFELQKIFSVANMMQPGTLAASQLVTMQTPGLVLFLTLPQAINGLLAFEEMLDTATKIADKLNGDVCDEQRQVLTKSTIEMLRSRILNFNLGLQSEQSQFKHDYSS